MRHGRRRVSAFCPRQRQYISTQVLTMASAGVWTGTIFEAPAETSPEFMFPARLINNLSNIRTERFIIRRRFAPAVTDLKTMAVYTDGACASNGLATPRGGFAFVFNENSNGTHARALENKGPTGEVQTHTNNRAELRAVIAFLKYRVWWGEGWKRIVVITDSEYVGKGATTWLRNWACNNWRTAAGRPTANRDLWEALSEVIGAFAEGGCEISFWVVPRRWNTRADAAAKVSCRQESREDYTNELGVLV
ncbi:ribonuclease H-like domain-containing protein [Ilyonectria robusta]|uniref:ribonuclease H-like domain-containing protein n=1 Tax=Ilyonectria robusta TaxID=1079257 RepID=UPI001E8E7BF4|nr:ribonuclease H-like domain-containing protein [Ilyonectria robusta]KAH8661758.1 ribonuclease H-like domain-containing protein [Ilyonectria robusta]